MHILNPIVGVAMKNLWEVNMQKEVIDKPERTAYEKGAVFEREVIKGICRITVQINLKTFYMYINTPDISPNYLPLSRIDRIIYFDNESNIPRLPTMGCRLLIPKAENFKSWDFIIEDCRSNQNQIVFVQVTTQCPDEHDKIQKSFVAVKDDRHGRNQIEIILDTIFETTGTKAHVDNGSIIVSLPLHYAAWSVKFLYITMQPCADLKTRNWEWKNVLVAGRETLEPLYLRFND